MTITTRIIPLSFSFTGGLYKLYSRRISKSRMLEDIFFIVGPWFCADGNFWVEWIEL
jgi:hypothetical protein